MSCGCRFTCVSGCEHVKRCPLAAFDSEIRRSIIRLVLRSMCYVCNKAYILRQRRNKAPALCRHRFGQSSRRRPPTKAATENGVIARLQRFTTALHRSDSAASKQSKGNAGELNVGIHLLRALSMSVVRTQLTPSPLVVTVHCRRSPSLASIVSFKLCQSDGASQVVIVPATPIMTTSATSRPTSEWHLNSDSDQASYCDSSARVLTDDYQLLSPSDDNDQSETDDEGDCESYLTKRQHHYYLDAATRKASTATAATLHNGHV